MYVSRVACNFLLFLTFLKSLKKFAAVLEIRVFKGNSIVTRQEGNEK